MSIVFVIDSEGQPLLPTHPARARKLLREGRAEVKQVAPFTIQLRRKIDNPVGSFEVGVDDGAKHVGIAVKNTKTQEVVFHAQLDHRQDVSGKVEQRRELRRARRQRLRCRPPRFDNRTKSKIAPSIRQRKDAILRVGSLTRCLLSSIRSRSSRSSRRRHPRSLTISRRECRRTS